MYGEYIQLRAMKIFQYLYDFCQHVCSKHQNRTICIITFWRGIFMKIFDWQITYGTTFINSSMNITLVCLFPSYMKRYLSV